MAYNLQPLITILEKILKPQQTLWILDDHNKPQLESLLQRATSLQKILEKSLLPKIESLERLIKDAAHEAEDMIESEMVGKMLCSPEGASFEFITPDLQKLMQDLDSAMDLVVKLVEVEGNKMRSGGSSSRGASDPSAKSSVVVVGVDEDLMQLKDRLTRMQRKLEIVPIVGMGGIGKTTLARELYQDPSIISHFQYARAWATISQDYNMKAILSSLLRCIIEKEFDEKHIEKESGELKDILYRSLYGRRYMIVLDDIWNTKFWDEIRMYFPNNDNGSRIVITTRESDVAKHADSLSVKHEVQLLGESASWNLLRQIVFGEEEENWPDHVLEEIGRNIASDCGGLPLAISVIGGVLSELEQSEDVWHHISTDVRGAIAGSDEQFSNILSLSYDHLPNHLKPCFLYMGAFPEDYDINASKLIRLWVAEGFVKLSSNGNNNDSRSLEEEAEDYLKALVERNLVSVKENKEYNGKKARRYNVHDLLRDLSIRKGEEDEFIHVMNEPQEDTYSSVRRLIVHEPSYVAGGDLHSYAELMSLGRSFIYFGNPSYSDSLSPNFFSELGLIRVLDIEERKFDEFPMEILQLVNLYYLALSCNSRLPREISKRLRNLQTLIAQVSSAVWYPMPCEIIWEMSELRHLELTQVINIKGEYTIEFVHKNLQTLSSVRVTDKLISIGFFDSIPNIRYLGIEIARDLSIGVVDLSRLHKLQTLRFSYLHAERVLIFPSNLRNLHLFSCTVRGELLPGLCALPNLELLEIDRCDFDFIEESEEDGSTEEKWEMKEGDEFRSLRFLLLKDCYELACWRADETNFPRLRRLVLERCPLLEEIPPGIGEIPTLELIEVSDCGYSVEESAERIVEEQQSEYDNYHLQLHITQ